MRINHNIAALNTYRQLSNNSVNGQKSLEKLSAGLRINKAGDDAAGLAISEKMRAQIRGLDQASRNAQDSISMIQTAEGALSETHSILQRMRELATQAANDTNVNVDRAEIQKEINQLTSEINRIGNTTEFNQQKLLKGKDVAVVETAATQATITAGVTGVAVGAISGLQTNANSQVALASSTYVQASTSAATGAISQTTVAADSVAGAKSSVTMANNVKFEALNTGTSLNGKTITILQATGKNVESSAIKDSSGNYQFYIGTKANGTSLVVDRGTLHNELKAALSNSGSTTADEITVIAPEPGSSTSLELSTFGSAGTLIGGKTENNGVYKFSVSDKFEEAGDTITIGGQKFTAVTGAADTSIGEFSVDKASAAVITGTSNVDLTANLGVINTVWTTGSITNGVGGTNAAVWKSGALGGPIVNATDNTVAFNGVTVTVAAATGAPVAAAATNSTTASVTIDTVGQTDQTVAEALKAAFEAARDYDDGNITDNALYGYTFSVEGTGAAAQFVITGPAVDTLSASDLSTVNELKMVKGNAGALTLGNDGKNALDPAAVGNVAAGSGGDYFDFEMNGDTVTVLLAKGDGTGAYSLGTAAANSATLIVDTNADGFSAETIANGLKAAFDQMTGGLVSLGKDVFSVNGSGAGAELVLTNTNTGTDDAETFEITHKASSTGNFAIVNEGVAAAGGNGNVAYKAAINAATKVDFIINDASGSPQTYNLNDAALKGLFDGSTTKDAILTAINTAISANGVASFNGDRLVVTSKHTGTTSEVKFDITAGAAGDMSRVATAFGMTDLLTGNGYAANTDDAQAANLQAAIMANNTLSGRFTAVALNGSITLTERADKATGTAIGDAVVAGAGSDDKLMITNTGGQNLYTITIEQNTSDTLAVDATNGGNNDGGVLIKLANTTASKNTATNIQKAVQALGERSYTIDGQTVKIDFSKYQFAATGEWDTKTVGNSIQEPKGTLVGGTQEVQGDYSFTITTAFKAGDIVEIKGYKFKAVESGADAKLGEFNVDNGNTITQAAGIADAISQNAAFANYAVQGANSTVSIVEKSATGTDLQASAVNVKALGTAGEYSVDMSKLLENGAKFIIDGKEIAVSDKNTNTGYSDGTAVKVADSAAAQAKALADAINLNASLKDKYTASVGSDGNLVLNQDEGYASSTAPAVSTKNSSIGNFKASFQIGANSGQSMTIDLEDMRSVAIGVSGDGTVSNVTANNGQVASYVTTANVTDGSTNTNVEFSLDVSSHEKASAAVSVINDAIEAVSGERSKLGAYQNRLEHTINNLGTSSENLTAAESRIRDVDMAKEMMEFTKQNILSQAAQAMLAQANQQPQGVLQLLR